MKERNKDISAFISLLAAGLTIFGSYNLQQEMVELRLNDKNVKSWVPSIHKREIKIKKLDKQSKILMGASILLLIWPITREIQLEKIEIDRQIRYNEIKRRRKRMGR